MISQDGLIALCKLRLGLEKMPDSGSGLGVSPFLGLQKFGQAFGLK